MLLTNYDLGGDIVNLRDARKQKNYTQEQLAIMAGVGRTTIVMIESGVNKPSVPLAKKLGELLDVDWTIFFD